MRAKALFSLFPRKLASEKRVYYYQCYDGDGRRTGARSTGFAKKTAAAAFCMELYRAGKLVPEKQGKEKRIVAPTFAEFSQGWWDYETCPYLKKRKGWRKIAKGYATQGQYAIKNHLIPDFGKRRLARA